MENNTAQKDKHQKCILCSSLELNKKGVYHTTNYLVQCNSCNLVFCDQIPTAEELDKHYSTYSYTTNQEISSLTIKSYNLLLDEFEKHRNFNRILDVGCGRGWFLVEAKKRGWEVYGTEFSPAAIDLCQKEGIEMRQGALSADAFPEGYFDVITSFEVIEHINTPNSDLTAIHNFLRKDGLFFCTTPNFNSLLRYYLKDKYNVIEYPEHLTYYTKRTLKGAASRNGFRTSKFKTTGISVSRIQNSLKSAEEVKSNNADDKIRDKISEKWYFGMIKNTLNFFLNLTNTGLTLKGYFIKK